MSRLKRFAHSLISGYLLLGANILFTLAQWPLAIQYLTPKEFGLWTVVASLSMNLQLLVDFGISGSVSRILIDHKDDEESASYGTIIKTSALAMLAQGVLIAVIGSAVSLGLPQWMKIESGFHHIFRHLMIGQCVLLGAAFVGRINTFILQAHQRYDIANYSQIGGFVVGLLTLWLGFEMHLGLYSLLLATAASAASTNLFCLIAVGKMKLFPAAGKWGRVEWHKFKEIFSYANEIFLLSVGQVLIAMSQTPLITFQLGLEANAVWSTMTKAFMLAQQLITRVFDFSATPFAEMMVRGEHDRLSSRFRDVVLLTGSIGVVVCLGVALGNGSFVQIWMNGKFSWPIENDLLMALFILVCTNTRCHIGLAGQTKQIGAMKYIYFTEGVVFIGLSIVLSGTFGMAGIILSGIVANLMCSGLYGLRRTTRYFSTSAGDVLLKWLQLPAILFALLLTVATALWFCTHRLPSATQLTVDVIGFGTLGSFLFWRFGLPEHLRVELSARFQWRRKV